MARALRGQRTSAPQAVAGQTPECSIASHGLSWAAGALDRYWLDPLAVAGELRGRGERAQGTLAAGSMAPPILAEGRAGRPGPRQLSSSVPVACHAMNFWRSTCNSYMPLRIGRSIVGDRTSAGHRS